jgi:hypothetical protein
MTGFSSASPAYRHSPGHATANASYVPAQNRRQPKGRRFPENVRNVLAAGPLVRPMSGSRSSAERAKITSSGHFPKKHPSRSQPGGHRETAVYELVIGEGGPKMKQVSAPAPPPPGPLLDRDGFPNVPNGSGWQFLNGRGRIQFRGQTMTKSNLCRFDRRLLGRSSGPLKGPFSLGILKASCSTATLPSRS